MTQSVNHFVDLPNELTWKIFSNIPNATPSTLCRVCKPWQSLFREEGNSRFWSACFEEACPEKFRLSISQTGSKNFQTIIKDFFTRNKHRVNFISSIIANDTELNECLHTNGGDLEKFKKKTHFERSRIIWKAISKDATPILLKLAKDGIQDFHNSKKLPQNPQTKEALESTYQLTLKLRSSFPIIEVLIKDYKVFYNKPKFICILLPDIRVIERAQYLFFSIINSHPDLSVLKTVNIDFPGKSENLPADLVITTLCLSPMYFGGECATKNDLVDCKLIEKDSAEI